MELDLRDVMVSEGDGNHEKTFLSSDLLCEVLSRVDALTLARASCVSSEFRRVCEGQEFWERICNLRWPSTKQAAAKGLISQTGGFRKFYARCHPCLSGKGTTSAEYVEPCPSPSLCILNKVEDDEPSPSNFVSIIDIIYNGQPMLSRIVAGFPGTEEPSRDWFEYCPFQFDLLEYPDEVNGIRKDEDGITSVAIQTNLSAVTPAEERKLGSLWKALNDNMTASWILINKQTGQMANLASCQSVGGLRHWPCDEEFVLHFGTIIPSIGLPFRNGAIHCNVAVKARYYTTDTISGGCKTAISVTEVGMKLENVEGARLYGMESIAFLDRALSCTRTVSHPTLLQSYQEFKTQQVERKAAKLQLENRRELIAALVSGIGAFLCLCYILL